MTPDDFDPIDDETALGGGAIGWLANPVGTNRYAYAGNDPVNKADPNGHSLDTSAQRQAEIDSAKFYGHHDWGSLLGGSGSASGSFGTQANGSHGVQVAQAESEERLDVEVEPSAESEIRAETYAPLRRRLEQLSPHDRLLENLTRPNSAASWDLIRETQNRIVELEARQVCTPESAESWGRANTLTDHFDRHGADFSASDEIDYANQAAEFLTRLQREGFPTRIDGSGNIRVYDLRTNSFGSYNPNGTTRTYYTPRTGIDYWNTQPGIPPTYIEGN